MSVLGGVGTALAKIGDKATKASKIKSVKAKIKVKFDPKAAAPQKSKDDLEQGA